MKLAATALALIVAAVAPTSTFAVTRARYLMGTVCEVSAADERQIEAAFAEAARVEAMLSTWRTDSELAQYNASRSHRSAELAALLGVVDEWRVKTNGAFDARIRPLIDAWKTREAGAVPAFKNGSRKRPTGVSAMWMLAPMVVSGYLMQVSTADALRHAMAIAHWISSGAFVVAYVAHILFRVGAGSQPARRSA